MDLNKFFSFFSPTSEDGDFHGSLESFKESPIYKIKIFERLIINGLIFKKSIVNFFSKADEDLDVSQIDLAGEFMMYNRAWFWISQLDWDDEQWVYDLKIASSESLLTAVNNPQRYKIVSLRITKPMEFPWLLSVTLR